MNNFTVSQIGDELFITFDDGTHKYFFKQKPSDDFAFDVAYAIDTISVKLAKLEKKEK